MNAMGSRFFKLAYRKEPISSFIIIVGAVDTVIGGVGGRWSLLSFGLLMVMLAIAVRWWQTQKREEELVEQPVTHYLPSSPSRPPLLMLNSSRRQSHR